MGYLLKCRHVPVGQHSRRAAEHCCEVRQGRPGIVVSVADRFVEEVARDDIDVQVITECLSTWFPIP
jgi:hypothetical protein